MLEDFCDLRFVVFKLDKITFVLLLRVLALVGFVIATRIKNFR